MIHLHHYFLYILLKTVHLDFLFHYCSLIDRQVVDRSVLVEVDEILGQVPDHIDKVSVELPLRDKYSLDHVEEHLGRGSTLNSL